MISQLTDFYLSHGYVAARVFIPEQDLQSGTLILEALEGQLSDIKTDDSVYAATAFPNMAGKIIELKDIEQGLAQINRLQSNQATSDIASGEKSGDSVLLIKNTPKKRWRLTYAYDNLGDINKGKYNHTFTYSYDNIFGINDVITFTHKKSVADNTINNIVYNGNYPFSTNYRLDYSAPYGY